MAKRKLDPSEEDLETLLYPNVPAQIYELSITRQALKEGEMKCELVGVTNVPNLAVLTPEAWTQALFRFLLQMHRNNYDHFKASCTSAVQEIKAEIDEELARVREAEYRRQTDLSERNLKAVK